MTSTSAADAFTPRSRRGQRSRAALVAAARQVFEDKGFVDAAVRDITEAAGASVGSFYIYFKDKDEIFAAVLAEANEQMLHPGVHVTNSDDPIAMIAASNRSYLEAYRDHAKLMKLLEQVSTTHPHFLDLRVERTMRFTERNVRAVRRLQKDGLADPTLDPTTTTIALQAMVSRTAYQLFALRTHDLDFETVVDTLTQLWVNALRIKPD